MMENMDKGLTGPKRVLIVWPKIPQMPPNLSAQFVCPSPKILDFNEKRLHWVFVVRVISRHWQSESKTVYYKTRMLPNRGLGTIASFIFYSYK